MVTTDKGGGLSWTLLGWLIERVKQGENRVLEARLCSSDAVKPIKARLGE